VLKIDFKKMIKSGQLRECPTCRHLTLKEKGLCNIIECAKCGIWWNWKTREQGHNGQDMKQRARMNGTLWEPGNKTYPRFRVFFFIDNFSFRRTSLSTRFRTT
jgi:hypothetical protein